MRDWNEHYEAGTMPWDIGRPDPLLVQAVEAGHLPAGRLLEIGCGTGDNARFLAKSGWSVLAVDIAPTAIEKARAAGGDVQYEVLGILESAPPGGSFDAVFDRGCFHIFSDPDQRARFAERVAQALRPGGVGLSLLGSTEGAPRDFGPPRRTAREIVNAVEPVLELLALRSAYFDQPTEEIPAWLCLPRRRSQPAQPSTQG
ncbi:class I SAM-dependent methyltransferase [Haliangium ochraceum]|uniref:Methyltransferase type 12 n=1 Tax=Haliangium ochraceum (strain DSM 14365 / JCM 11303 / SMP-2) TaxID=502025 RepID=D0LQL4_HALO1|nr:class I SAM-dependent methyltransferase [Haliangium ochraceum]ACY13574.1 Methyltransferase type 12 [Haliangium ochraceum DSM 14365]